MRKWQEVQKLPRKEHLIKSFLSIKKAHSYSYEWAFYSIIIPIETSSQPNLYPIRRLQKSDLKTIFSV